jgi:hypothetical protein
VEGRLHPQRQRNLPRFLTLPGWPAIEPPHESEIVWAEDAKPGQARTDAPRHAEHMAMAMYQRVARRKPGQRRRRFNRTNLVLAGVCLVLAIALFPVDAPLLHLPAAAFGFAALVLGIKGLMGY